MGKKARLRRERGRIPRDLTETTVELEAIRRTIRHFKNQPKDALAFAAVSWSGATSEEERERLVDITASELGVERGNVLRFFEVITMATSQINLELPE